MKNWLSLSCWKLSEDYFDFLFLLKIDFHQFMTSWRCKFCWFYQKMRFFALFDSFNPNIWKIYPTYLVANLLNIILKKLFLPKSRFSPIYNVMKVWILLILTKNLYFALFDPFKLNIWKFDLAYLVANFLKIILKKNVLLNNQFAPNYDVMKVWNLVTIPKKMRVLLLLTHLI